MTERLDISPPSGSGASPLAAADTITVYRADRQAVAAATYHTIFNVTTGGVELLGGVLNGAEAGVRLTIDGTVVLTQTAYALGVDAGATVNIAALALPWAKANVSMKLEIYNIHPSLSRSLGWRVFTR